MIKYEGRTVYGHAENMDTFGQMATLRIILS